MAEGVRGQMSLGSAVNQRRGHDHAAEVHPMLVEMRGQGLTFSQIAYTLNSRGIRTRHGHRWAGESVRAVFRLHLDDIASTPKRPLAPGPATVRRRALEWAAKIRPVVIEIQQQGLSFSEIADVLNKRGIRTRRRARWTSGYVRKFITRSSK